MAFFARFVRQMGRACQQEAETRRSQTQLATHRPLSPQTEMMQEQRLFDYKKECLFKALDRNLEWAKRTNEIALQAKRWCVAFWLIYVGLLVKDVGSQVGWVHVAFGILGIIFFLILDLMQHFYSELIQKSWYEINRQIVDLPSMGSQKLEAFEVLPTKPRHTYTRRRKFIIFLSMLQHETIWLFYGGLLLLMLVVFCALRYMGA
jgi:hypothetical protein